MSEKNFRSLMESLKDIDDTDGQHGKKYAYECGACGYTVNSDNKLEGNECPECGGSLSLMKNSSDKKNEDDDNTEDDITEDASKDNSGFTYQDEKGNLYHSDVEIASYRDPETGKIERVFTYGKDGVSKPTRAVPAIVSGMGESIDSTRALRRSKFAKNESLKNLKLKISKLEKENEKLTHKIKESLKATRSSRVNQTNEDDDPDDNLDESTSPVTYISGDPKKLDKVEVYPTTLEDKDIAALLDSSLVKVDDDQDSFELTAGSLKGSFLVPSENLDKEVEVQEGNSDSDLTDVSGKASYYLVTPLVDDDQDVNDLLSDSITPSDDDAEKTTDGDNKDKVDD